MQRADAGIAAPGKHQFLRAARADQQVINQIRGHPYQSQVFLVLADKLVGGGGGNQVREAFKRNGIAVADEAIHCFAKGQEFGHGSVSCR